MPTGYTYKLVDGPDQTFPEFAYDLVRNMGAFIHMRDYPGSAVLTWPEEGWAKKGSAEGIRDYKERLEEQEAEYDVLLSLTPGEVAMAYDEYQIQTTKEYEERLAKVTPIRKRLLSMRAKVENWLPPTKDHIGFKEFMLEQLDTTIKWDGDLPCQPTFSNTAKEWHEENLSAQERYVERCRELLQEEKNCPDVQEGRVDWISELVESIPPPPGRFDFSTRP